VTPTTPRNRFLSALALFAASGCAGTIHASTTTATHASGAPVRIDGLGFLRLDASRADVVATMRERGYLCLDVAATQQHVPCTLANAEAPLSQVILTFYDDALSEIWTVLAPPVGAPRAYFDRLCAAAGERWPNAIVHRTGQVARARFYPGDGSTIEIQHYTDAHNIEAQQILARRPTVLTHATWEKSSFMVVGR
jgi:hypothetical protein